MWLLIHYFSKRALVSVVSSLVKIDCAMIRRNCRDSPTVWPLCAFFFLLLQFYVPFYVKKKKIDNFMCLLEFECPKRLKAHSRAIPGTAFDFLIYCLMWLWYYWYLRCRSLSRLWLDTSCKHWFSAWLLTSIWTLWQWRCVELRSVLPPNLINLKLVLGLKSIFMICATLQ